MARDSQTALVALNRFGLGARGGASGDLVNAASDPRGFVKAELSRPNGALLEMPGLQSTPALGRSRVRLSGGSQGRARGGREGGCGSFRGQPGAAGGGCQGAAAQPVAQQRRDGNVGKRSGDEAAGQRQCRRDDGGDRSDAAERAKTAAATAQRHPEDLPRRGAGAAAARGHRRLRVYRTAGGVLVQSFLHLRQQGRIGADVGGLVRARGDPPACARTLRRHAQGGRAASGDAFFPRQPAIARAGLARRAEPQARPQRKPRARNHGAAYAGCRRRLLPGRCDLARAHHHRLDLRRTAGAARRARQFCLQRQCASAGPASPARQDLRKRRRRAGRSGARRYRAPSFHRQIHRDKVRASFCGGRSAAGAGGAAAGGIPQNRRRSPGDDPGAGGFRRGLAGAADQGAFAL